MAVPKPIRNAAGSYSGDSTLYMMTSAGLSEDKGKSKLHIEFDRRNQYATVTYTWTYDGKENEGTALIASNQKGDDVTIGWTDNWHMAGGVLHLAGAVVDGEVSCKGKYAAPPGPDWGWRITFSATKDSVTMKMYNATPDGQEMIAVEGLYKLD